MTIKNRLAQLEKESPPVIAPEVNTAITDETYNRSMEALAAALGGITGDAITAAEAEQAIKEINRDH